MILSSLSILHDKTTPSDMFLRIILYIFTIVYIILKWKGFENEEIIRKKRKIIIALLLAEGLFVNISDSNVSPSANSIDAFSERGPIGGDH